LLDFHPPLGGFWYSASYWFILLVFLLLLGVYIVIAFLLVISVDWSCQYFTLFPCHFPTSYGLFLPVFHLLLVDNDVPYVIGCSGSSSLRILSHFCTTGMSTVHSDNVNSNKNYKVDTDDKEYDTGSSTQLQYDSSLKIMMMPILIRIEYVWLNFIWSTFFLL
jgi:hypothetical protein